MSKVKSFSKGDFVVYPTHGVGKVTDVANHKVAGQELELIVVRFDKDRMTLRVPVVKAEQSGLRRLSSQKIMEDALGTLTGKAKVKRMMWSRRAQEYEAKINSGDPVSIAEVVRDLYRPSDQAEQSYSERQIYEQALDRLAHEVAAVDDTTSSEATVKLTGILNKHSA
jgi:CarD family transcriptional regulator